MFWVAQGVPNARDMLEAGFTTVRNVGSDNYSDVGYKQAIDEGLISGPRIVPAAHSLGATGGHCDQTYLPPSSQGQAARRSATGRRSCAAGARAAQIWRRGDQGLRHRRRLLAQHRAGQQQLSRRSCAPSPTRRINGA
jgi:imidazolonepropionase-like amidohydrolase